MLVIYTNLKLSYNDTIGTASRTYCDFLIVTDVEFSNGCVTTLSNQNCGSLKIDLQIKWNDVDVSVTRLKMYIRTAKSYSGTNLTQWAPLVSRPVNLNFMY